MHCTLENWTGFWLAAERILYCQYCFLSTVIELYQDILMKCLSLHSAGVYKITDCFGHKFEENKYRGNKDYLLLGQKYAPVKIDSSIENVTTLPSFMHACNNNVLFHLQS